MGVSGGGADSVEEAADPAVAAVESAEGSAAAGEEGTGVAVGGGCMGVVGAV
jgi:hypothetical protein